MINYRKDGSIFDSGAQVLVNPVNAVGVMGKGLALLMPTNNVKAQMMQLPDNERQRLHYLPPGPDRWKERSRTFLGIASAMAEQYSLFICDNAEYMLKYGYANK